MNHPNNFNHFMPPLNIKSPFLQKNKAIFFRMDQGSINGKILSDREILNGLDETPKRPPNQTKFGLTSKLYQMFTNSNEVRGDFHFRWLKIFLRMEH